MKTVEIPTAANEKIEGTLVLPTGTQLNAAILFMHGWGSGRQAHLVPAKLAAGLGFLCLAIDLRGHGKSARLRKTVSARDNLCDALAAYDYLAARHDIDAKRIGLAGFSYGAFLAILVAAERRVGWLALRAPALYRDQDLDIPKSSIKRRGLMAYRKMPLAVNGSFALRAASRVSAEVLLVESEHDRIVPRQQVANYLNAFAKAKSLTHIVIAGADHALSQHKWYREGVNVLIEWLQQRVHHQNSRATRLRAI